MSKPRQRGPSAPKDRFPARVYAETVLAVNFEDAKHYFLDALLEIHSAHTLMLARQGIISAADARSCLEALDHLDRAAIQEATYDGRCEDLFFYIEDLLAKACGAEAAGKMHTARSRNDIDLAMYRIIVRRKVLEFAGATEEVRQVLMDLAVANLETIIPAYTHTQPAQPTTLAHYLMAAVEFLGRDLGRLRAAFATVNRCPLGACAITTTGFSIDRRYTSRLLGFDELQRNSYGAIAAIDYLTKAAAALAVAMINLGKLTQDLLLWCTGEFNFLGLSDAYVQTSSIMPQKRNPVDLEHVRILASKALGQSQAVLTCAHNTPFGDIVDGEDDLQPLVFSMFADAIRADRLFADLLAHCEVQHDRLRARAEGGFLTATELADTLVRREKLTFRLAHQLVSAAVKASGANQRPERLIAELERLAPRMLGRRLESPRRDLLRALDVDNFVRVRNLPGGPAPAAVRTEIERAGEDGAEFHAWQMKKTQQLERYPQRIRQEIEALRKRSSKGGRVRPLQTRSRARSL